MKIIRKIAAFLLSMGVLTIILTIVQPMPKADAYFRPGAVIVIVVCAGVLLGLRAIERNRAKQQTSKDPSQSAHDGKA